MQDLKLHSFGQNDHLESLKKKCDSLKQKINGNKKLTEVEKKAELETLTKSFDREKRESKNNLY